MSEEIVIGFDELSSLMRGDHLYLDDDDHDIIKNPDDSVTIVIDPETGSVIENPDSPMIGESLFEDIHLRLASFGFTDLSEADEMLIRYLSEKNKQLARNWMNNDKIPDGLHFELVEAICADYLHLMYSAGKIKLSTSPVASVKEGDTTVTYGTQSASIVPEKIFLNILNSMRLKGRDVVRYRRMAW